MKKIMSLVMAGAVMLSLSACSAGSKPSDTSAASVTETTLGTTTEATTTTTTEETTTEETTTESSAEPEINFDEMLPKEGEIFTDFKEQRYDDISDNILKALWLRTGTTAKEYAASGCSSGCTARTKLSVPIRSVSVHAYPVSPH